MFNKTKKNNSFLFILIILIFSVGLTYKAVLAESMTSTNYSISVDSINVGGLYQTSTNYISQETIGEIATGISTTTYYNIHAGYQAMLTEYYLSLSIPFDITLSPNIKQISGGQSTGSGQVNVTTDNSAGYNLAVKASASPALTTAGDSFADYTSAVVGVPDYSWVINAADSEFGFTVEGSDIVQRFQDDGVLCNVAGADTSDACWYNLAVSETTIANVYSPNTPAGAVTTLKFQAESGSSHNQTSGAYQAVITITVLAN